MSYLDDIQFTKEEEALISYLEEQKTNKQQIQTSFKNDIQLKKKYKKLFRKSQYRKFLDEIKKEMKDNKELYFT